MPHRSNAALAVALLCSSAELRLNASERLDSRLPPDRGTRERAEERHRLRAAMMRHREREV